MISSAVPRHPDLQATPRTPWNPRGLNGLQRNWELKMSWECLEGKIMEILGGNI